MRLPQDVSLMVTLGEKHLHGIVFSSFIFGGRIPVELQIVGTAINRGFVEGHRVESKVGAGRN